MGGEESRAHPLETPLPSPIRQYKEWYHDEIYIKGEGSYALATHSTNTKPILKFLPPWKHWTYICFKVSFEKFVDSEQATPKWDMLEDDSFITVLRHRSLLVDFRASVWNRTRYWEEHPEGVASGGEEKKINCSTNESLEEENISRLRSTSKHLGYGKARSQVDEACVRQVPESSVHQTIDISILIGADI